MPPRDPCCCCRCPLVICRFLFFFVSLSYFINKGYFVISKLCPHCPKTTDSSSFSATCVADSGTGALPGPVAFSSSGCGWLVPTHLPEFVHSASLIHHYRSVGVRVARGVGDWLPGKEGREASRGGNLGAGPWLKRRSTPRRRTGGVLGRRPAQGGRQRWTGTTHTEWEEHGEGGRERSLKGVF